MGLDLRAAAASLQVDTPYSRAFLNFWIAQAG
jgi:hypothetical protein